MQKTGLWWLVFAACAVPPALSGGETFEHTAPSLRLSPMFGDHMVLQRDAEVPVWGWAAPGESVAVSFAEREGRAIADEAGEWRVALPPMAAGGPFELEITGRTSVRCHNVMIGDVWICSGQSNMEMHLRPGPDAVYSAEQEVASADFPAVRLLTIPRTTSFEPRRDFESEGWLVCTPEHVITFSAVGYFFGRDLHEHLKVPVGLINASKGASPAEAWTSAGALHTLPAYRQTIDALPEQIAASKALFPEFQRQAAAWEALLEARDAGQKDARPVYAMPDLDDTGWSSMQVPDHFENAGYPDFDGVMWFRKEVELPSAWAGRPLRLGLCTINDMDRAYFNGVEVGRFESTAGWTAPRVYDVPAACAKPGKNLLAVRVFDAGNKGGLCGAPGDLWIKPDDQGGESPIALSGMWRMAPGLDLKSLPPKPLPPPLVETNHRIPGVLFNAMIAPMIPFAVKGVIWYQGESNSTRADEYATLFPALIQDWRTRWAQPAFPFLFVQLASIGQAPPQPVDDALSRLREAQSKALALPETAMTVTIDIGDPVLGHPRNKQEVGRRLARAARRVAYGENLVAWGPLYAGMEIEGNRIRVHFDGVGSGLAVSNGETVQGFAIAGVDRVFVWADARIEQDGVLVNSPRISEPVAVRYAWSSYPAANLCNKEGFPASPFRTDTWPMSEN